MLQLAKVAQVSSKAYSTKFEDHTGMLHKLAKRAWGRLQEAGVTVPYEDVFQNFCESFVRCEATFKADTGFTFSAYYGRSCWNNFNRWAEGQINEKHTLGMVSVEELGNDSDHDGGGDVLEFGDFADEDDAHESPEDILSARQESHRAARMLTPVAKRVVALLAHNTPELLAFMDQRNARMLKKSDNITLRVIFDFLDLAPARARAVRAELQQVYGVTL
jgi:DNA-directed RNA polymerase specialized sigma24 family protein